MKRIILFLIIFGIILSSTGLLAQGADEVYKKANLSYENEDYEKAISLYEVLIKMDRVSPEVFYNLGNSFFKLKKIGMAILNYERALRIAPADRDIRLNLKLSQAMTLDKINTPERGFILNIILFLYDILNINELTALVSIFYFIIILLLILAIFIVRKRKIIFYNVAVFGAVLVILLAFLAVKIQNECMTKSAIIIAEKVDVRSGPKEDYIVQFSLHEGTKIRIIDQRQDWYSVELSKDLKGWLPKASVEII